MQILCHSENYVNLVHMDDGKKQCFQAWEEYKERKPRISRQMPRSIPRAWKQIGRRPTINRKRAQRDETVDTWIIEQRI